MLRILTFLSVATVIVGGVHYYLFARLVRDTALPAPYRAVATALLVALAVSMPASMIVSRFYHSSVTRALSWPLYVWMGVMMLLFLALAATELPRVLALLALRAGPDPVDAERRQLFQRVLGGAVVLTAGSLSAFAMRAARRPVAVRKVEVSLARLPRALDGHTIVQVSDLHVGPTLGKSWLEEVVGHINQLSPDVVAITGDLIDGSVAELRDAVSPLASLRARHGVYFVTGNHEYYSGADAWIAELGRLNVRVLRNERVSIGGEGGSFDLAGVDDFHSQDLAPGHGPDLVRALAGRDATRELVLLAHQPKAVHEAARLGVGLQLSGHTHGGQIWPWNYAVLLQQPYVAGLVREGNTQLYVSCGTGYWGPPMRLGAPAEITHITLRSA